MSVKVKWIMEQMEKYAPTELALDWDNVGLILGHSENEVEKVLVALDFTDEVLDEAIQLKAGLVITHHPAIFQAIKQINNQTVLGTKILKSVENHISVYSAHTNLDITTNGTNDTLSDLLELSGRVGLNETENNNFLGRAGYLKEKMSLKALAGYVKHKLGLEGIRFVGEPDTEVFKIGLGTGSCSQTSFFRAAKAQNCDVFITGDIKFHEAQAALEMGLCLVDATHYASEVLIVKEISDYLKQSAHAACIDIEVIRSEVDGQTFKIG